MSVYVSVDVVVLVKHNPAMPTLTYHHQPQNPNPNPTPQTPTYRPPTHQPQPQPPPKKTQVGITASERGDDYARTKQEVASLVASINAANADLPEPPVCAVVVWLWV